MPSISRRVGDVAARARARATWRNTCIAGSSLLERNWQEKKARAVRTEADGTFRFEGVRPGQWHVGPAPGLEEEGEVFAPRSTVVEVTGEEPVVEVQLVAWRDLSLSGHVVSSGVEACAIG